MAAQASSPHVSLIFDGTCGFCTRQVRYIHKLDKHQRVVSEPCQFVQHLPKYGLQDADCGAMAWAITDDGRRAGGAQAFTLIASVLLDKQWPVAVGKLPVIKQALDLGYRVIAKNRYRFPGDTPPIEGGSCRVGGGASNCS
jgi:predicted DCC family thiol-disulfide oxidoreductase YuxK